MTNEAIATHLAGLDPRYQPVARALHAAIIQAAPELRAAIKWGRLSYLLDGSGLLWVCAVTTTSQAANLRFFYGTPMADPAGVLRGGKSRMMTWDIATLNELDLPLVQAYVREAVKLAAGYEAGGRQGGARPASAPG